MTKIELIHELHNLELKEPTKRISHPSEAVSLFITYVDKPVEYFLMVTLNGAHEVLNTHEITKGILDRTLIHPREVFLPAIKDRAAAIILGHNHPSGKTDPSPEDKEITKRLVDAGVILGIPVLDHVIVSLNGYYSFLEDGKL